MSATIKMAVVVAAADVRKIMDAELLDEDTEGASDEVVEIMTKNDHLKISYTRVVTKRVIIRLIVARPKKWK
jgi:hypothetical protein